MKLSAFVLVGFAGLALAQAAFAEDRPSAAAGRRIAAARCGACHATDRAGDSPNPRAPRFRDLGARYPLDDLREALAEGMIVGHPQLMPVIALEPAEIGNLIAYMKSLQPRPAARPRARLRPAAG